MVLVLAKCQSTPGLAVLGRMSPALYKTGMHCLHMPGVSAAAMSAGDYEGVQCAGVLLHRVVVCDSGTIARAVAVDQTADRLVPAALRLREVSSKDSYMSRAELLSPLGRCHGPWGLNAPGL